jgi:hypothetical protein
VAWPSAYPSSPQAAGTYPRRNKNAVQDQLNGMTVKGDFFVVDSGAVHATDQ